MRLVSIEHSIIATYRTRNLKTEDHKMKICSIFSVAILASVSSVAVAGTCDRLSGDRRRVCEQSERDAERYRQDAKKYERLGQVRDAICVADSVAAAAAAKVAGWRGGIVYRGTRAAANAISNGASSCVARAQ